ncbi:MAG: c-type cytochrome [Candidatus Binatia bacterium]
MRARWFIFFSLSLTLTACTGDSEKTTQTVLGPNVDRGRRLYLLNCTSCHNRDPSKQGATGPAVKGSSEALLEAKILRGSYPPGYVPKRRSSSMQRYPYLKKAIPDIAAYLR